MLLFPSACCPLQTVDGPKEEPPEQAVGEVLHGVYQSTMSVKGG